MLTPTTELQAVNIMLSGIGESPVNTLEGTTTTDVSLAKSILEEISRDFQLEGWSFNTERNYPLSVNEDNEVKVPSNVARVYFREPDSRVYVLRGRRIYNTKTHSFKFPAETPSSFRNCAAVLLLDFTELPETARRYVTIKATRIFQERTVGSVELSGYQRDDETRARALFLHEEDRSGRHNMLQGYLAPRGCGWQVFETMNRVI